MKNKTLTYVLGIAVVAVWGMIIYRVIAATGGDNTGVRLPISTYKKEAMNDYEVPKDTTRLLMNYRDPFGVPKADTDEIPIKKLIRNSPVRPMQQKLAMNWNFIRYSGFIKNPANKKLIAIMTINGKAVMLNEGETAEQVKLLKNMKDSIRISYQGKTTFITMNNKTL